jgi:hypothetical protein
MDALVVFESMFGNTKALAEAVRDGLATHLDTELVEVDAAPTVLPAQLRLLVVGGPTHAFGLSRSTTRADAAKDVLEGVTPSTTGLREWLDALPPGYAGFVQPRSGLALRHGVNAQTVTKWRAYFDVQRELAFMSRRLPEPLYQVDARSRRRAKGGRRRQPTDLDSGSAIGHSPARCCEFPQKSRENADEAVGLGRRDARAPATISRTRPRHRPPGRHDDAGRCRG